MNAFTDRAAFVLAAARRPREVATIFPTSRALAERMIASVDFDCRLLVELGPGSGAITRPLLERLNPAAYLGLEINADLVTLLRERFPGATFERRSALDVAERVGPGEADHVVSSLPWTVFSAEDRERGVVSVHEALRPGGTFLTYVCMNAMPYPSARALLKSLRARFRRVDRVALEWRNVPPAFVFRAEK